MELDVPMMEIGYAFGGELEKHNKSLHSDARTLGARWLRSRIESSAKLRWNPLRAKSLRLTRLVAIYAIEHSAKAVITADELSDAIRQLGKPDQRGRKIRLEECPF